jgi:hypothetical protein
MQPEPSSPPEPASRTTSLGGLHHSSAGDRVRDHRQALIAGSSSRRPVETFVRREDAEHFVDEVRGDDPELASHLRIEKRELEVGEPN